MTIERASHHRRSSKGMALLIVLVLLAGLWLLCLLLLSLTTTGSRSDRIRTDALQAELAALAGMEDVKRLLLDACKVDDFLVVQEKSEGVAHAPRLYLVRPELEGSDLIYRYHPMFSSHTAPTKKFRLSAPKYHQAHEPTGRWYAHPWSEPVRVDWLPLINEEGDLVARYGFWLEDLEGNVDPSLVSEGVNLQAMDHSPDQRQWQRLQRGKQLLVSPNSALAAAGFRPPLERLNGRLLDPWADFLERNTFIGLQAYEEQSLVPYLDGISNHVMGKPKRNLNRLLSIDRGDAIEDMADWIKRGLPEFEGRKGGFPEQYLQTLAANALDYADVDAQPMISPGCYRGIDGQPFISEVVLHLHYQGMVREEERWVMKWTFRLFAELWNMGSQAIENGQAQLSYEVNLRPTAVGLGAQGLPFDSPTLLEDDHQSTHTLKRHGSSYVTQPVKVSLRPDEYRFYEFARVDYRIDCIPQLDAEGQPLAEWFDLVEMEHEARGLSLIWNDREVERLARLHRDPHGLANFRTDRRRKTAKACIAGLNYGGYGSKINNLGDPRISHYLRVLAVGENAYPENLSPHRRNIRRRNIYDKDPSRHKTRHYGRVMPSQWPDGGHDSATGDFRVTTSDARFPTDPDWWPHTAVPLSRASDAPQQLSNRGVFDSATELGLVYDPLMWTPAYTELKDTPGSGKHDTDQLLGRLSIFQRPAMPLRRGRWPEVSWVSQPSMVYGGGHSLRIGRPEHQRFDRPGMRASHLLDLFHCGQPDSAYESERHGSTIRVHGRINLNTASRDVLRCLAYDALSGESISQVVDTAHDTAHAFGPQLQSWRPNRAELERHAKAVAEGIIRSRPFASLSELSHLRDEQGRSLFGDQEQLATDIHLQWSDRTSESLFGRMYCSSGLRSRHFRVWLVGQSLNSRGEVSAQCRRAVVVFVDPGQRGHLGQVMPEQQQVKILHRHDF